MRASAPSRWGKFDTRGQGGDTEDYPADEVQDMAQRIASDVGASVWSVQDEKEVDKLTLRGPSIGGDDDVMKCLVGLAGFIALSAEYVRDQHAAKSLKSLCCQRCSVGG